MSSREDDIRRVTIGILDAVEMGLKESFRVFEEVAGGVPLDPQRAENLAAQTANYLKILAETRNSLRLSADSSGVH